MSTLALARKYRPQKFAELVSQETTAKILQSAIGIKRVASAYLFSGPRGTGKTTTARLFAKALNCANSPALTQSKGAVEPCESCSSCKEITLGSSMDVLELDAASHTQVEKIREVIIDSVSFAPVRDRYKIFIIDEVHMLSNHSFNALLKTLEEPPPHSVFILATTEYHKIPATVISRCQRFRFLPLTVKEIADALKKIALLEKIPIEEDALPLIAKAAGGSMRDGLSLLDQVYSHVQGESASIDRKRVEAILGNISAEFVEGLTQKIVQGDAKSVLELIGIYCKEGADISYLLKELREAFREMLIRKSGYRDENSLLSELNLPVGDISLERILRSIQILTKCAEQMRWSDSPRIVFECYAVKLCQPIVAIEEVIKQLERHSGSPRRADSSRNPDENSPKMDSGFRRNDGQIENDGDTGNHNEISNNKEIEEKSIEIVPDSKGVSQAEEIYLKENWKKILALLQEAKPFLHQNIVKAHPRLENGTLELRFQKEFWLSAVKRNAAIVEKIAEEVLGKKVSAAFKLDESLPEPKIEEQIKTELIRAPIFEQEVPVPSDQEGMLEMDLGTESTQRKEVRVEDEGLKKFVHFFPGTLTKKEKEAPVK